MGKGAAKTPAAREGAARRQYDTSLAFVSWLRSAERASAFLLEQPSPLDASLFVLTPEELGPALRGGESRGLRARVSSRRTHLGIQRALLSRVEHLNHCLAVLAVAALLHVHVIVIIVVEVRSDAALSRGISGGRF